MSRSSMSKKNWLAHYSELVGSWARKWSNRQDAEDALQDVALKMLEQDTAVLRDYEPYYFQRAASNRAISIYRAEQVRQTQSLDALPEESHPMEPSSHELYEADETARIMLDALNTLPQACQIAFKLRQVEGLSNGEIADKMGVSRNMVERYMMRTLRHLHDQLHKNAH
ncbi:MAG: sigma-70 family RNA polymerase sigma factor [Paenalcaligenes sp.]